MTQKLSSKIKVKNSNIPIIRYIREPSERRCLSPPTVIKPKITNQELILTLGAGDVSPPTVIKPKITNQELIPPPPEPLDLVVVAVVVVVVATKSHLIHTYETIALMKSIENILQIPSVLWTETPQAVSSVD